jgi:hypothetical protein
MADEFTAPPTIYVPEPMGRQLASNIDVYMHLLENQPLCEVVLEYAHHMRTPANRIILLSHERLLRPLKLYPHTTLYAFQEELRERLVFFAWELLELHRHHPFLLPVLQHYVHHEESIEDDTNAADSPHEAEEPVRPHPETNNPFYYINEDRTNSNTNE